MQDTAQYFSVNIPPKKIVNNTHFRAKFKKKKHENCVHENYSHVRLYISVRTTQLVFPQKTHHSIELKLNSLFSVFLNWNIYCFFSFFMLFAAFIIFFIYYCFPHSEIFDFLPFFISFSLKFSYSFDFLDFILLSTLIVAVS